MARFTRQENGDVLIEEGETKILVQKSHWISDVLSVTRHSERPGDFHAWEAHHDGTKDILEGRRGGY